MTAQWRTSRTHTNEGVKIFNDEGGFTPEFIDTLDRPRCIMSNGRGSDRTYSIGADNLILLCYATNDDPDEYYPWYYAKILDGRMISGKCKFYHTQREALIDLIEGFNPFNSDTEICPGCGRDEYLDHQRKYGVCRDCYS